MSVVYVVLPVALVIAVVAVFVFIRAARAGQFDDLDTPGLRVLHDDMPLEDRPERKEESTGGPGDSCRPHSSGKG